MTIPAAAQAPIRPARRRSVAAAILAVAVVAAGSAVGTGTPARAVDTGCFAADVVVERWKDGRGVVAFTTTPEQESAATAAGFTATGDAFAAASQWSPGLAPLYDAYRPANGDHAWILWQSEYNSVVSVGWEGRGVVGYVSPRALADCDPQVRLTRAVGGGLHTVARGDTEAAAARASGLALEYSWYAPSAASEFAESPAPTPPTEPTPAPPTEPAPVPPTEPAPVPPTEPAPVPPAPGDGDGKFTVATIPDTQQEVYASSGTKFLDRSKWLVAQQQALDLRFVAHTGDVVSWDTDTHDQYVRAEAALDPLEAAGIPYQLSIGNHDTMAVGIGGSARDPARTYEYQRVTTTFNQFWAPSDYSALAGMFEEGKVDNTYSTFSAEGTKWLVLNLELWPRIGVVDWAERVIAANPGHNVIIQTHSFLNSAADIEAAGHAATRYQYGDASPQYVYDRLVAPFGNVKIVTSGHTGIAASKVITTAAGNKVAFMLQALHSNTNNPVRLSQIDVTGGTISTRVFAPLDGATWDTTTLTGLTFVRG